MTWDELVESITARHPVHESKMFGMPCLKRENGKVVTGVGSTEPPESGGAGFAGAEADSG